MNELKIIELENDEIISDAKSLLIEYGKYMYKDLGLTAGKLTFYQNLKFFQRRIIKRQEVPFGLHI